MDAESILRKAFPELCGEPAVYELPLNAAPIGAPLPLRPAPGPQAHLQPPYAPPPPQAHAPNAVPHSLGNRFDAIAGEIHKLEQACRRERDLAARWKEQAEQLNRRLRTIEQSEKHLLAQVSELAQGENSAASEKKAMTEELVKIRGELDQYRKAWVAIRKREEAARAALQENATLRSQLETLTHQARQLHGMCHEERSRAQASARHAASLEDSVRQIQEKVQALETRNVHLSTEIQTLHELCKSYETEVARVGEATRAREEALRLAAERELQARYDRELQAARKHAESELASARKQADTEIQSARRDARQATEEAARESDERVAQAREALENQYARNLATMKTEFERCSAEESARSRSSLAELIAEREAQTSAFERRAKAAERLAEERRAEAQARETEAESRLAEAEARLRAEHEGATADHRTRLDGERERLRGAHQQEIENLRATQQTELRRLSSQHQSALDKLRAESDARARASGESERGRREALERECELAHTALRSQAGEAREAARRIRELAAQAGESEAAAEIAELARRLHEASEIPTIAPSPGKANRAGGKTSLDC